MTIARGEVYFVDLGRPEGHELGHEHPVVVLSINDINRKPLVVVVVPGTSLKEGKPVRPNQVLIHASETNGLTKIRSAQAKTSNWSLSGSQRWRSFVPSKTQDATSR